LRVRTPNEDGWANTPYADRLNNTYLYVVQSDAVMGELMDRLDLEEAPEVELSAVPNSELLELTVHSDNPEIVNTLAEILTARNRELYYGYRQSNSEQILQQIAQTEAQLNSLLNEFNLTGDDRISRDALTVTDARQLSNAEELLSDLQFEYAQTVFLESQQSSAVFITQPAVAPEEPSGPPRLIIMGTAFILSLVLGMGMAIIFESLDSKLYSSQEIEEYVGMHAIGKIPNNRALATPVNASGHFPTVESFRQIRANIFAVDENAPQTVLIASAEPKEGKSTIAANLARVLAKTENKVLLIDADLRLPTQHEHFGLKNNIGLSSFLNRTHRLSQAIQFHEKTGVNIMTSGPITSDTAELVATKRMQRLLEHLTSVFDVVLIDSPAMNAVADAVELATHVDSVVLVVARGRSKQGSIVTAMEQLDFVGANLSGVVVNRSEGKRTQTYYTANTKAGSSNTQLAEAPTQTPA
jgi:capsular exopolysaccharide synthesis family protein